MAMAQRALALLLLLALTTALPPTSDARVLSGGMFVECHQGAAPSASNGSAFRAHLHALLVDLPSATDPTGFASLHSDNGPFVRGLCFDVSQRPGGCSECLTAAAKKIADECGGSRRAGIWSTDCFVSYADSNASSAHDDAYRGRDFGTDGYTYAAFYNTSELADLALSLAPRAANSSSGPMMATADMTTGGKGTVHAVARCPSDVTEGDCTRCLEKSAGELLDGSWEWGYDGRHEGVAVVEGFNCHLRLEIHAPHQSFGQILRKWIKENVALFVLIVVTAVIVVLGVVCVCIIRVRIPRQHHNA